MKDIFHQELEDAKNRPDCALPQGITDNDDLMAQLYLFQVQKENEQQAVRLKMLKKKMCGLKKSHKGNSSLAVANSVLLAQALKQIHHFNKASFDKNHSKTVNSKTIVSLDERHERAEDNQSQTRCILDHQQDEQLQQQKCPMCGKRGE
jgi:hypothetical protein